MKLLIKYSNIIIFAIVLVLFFVIQPYKKFSLELSSLLNKEDKVLHNLVNKINYNTTLFVAVKGFSKKDLIKLKRIKKELTKFPEISIYKKLNNKKLQEFKKKYTLYLNDLNYRDSSEINVENTLSDIYEEILSSSLYMNINKVDPLKIIKKKEFYNKTKIKNGNIILEDYGYLALFSLDIGKTTQSKNKTYYNINSVLNNYKDTKSFSSLFYYVENSKKTKSDIEMIITISLILMGILYLIILRNLHLFINVSLTLVTSVIVGQIVTTYIYPQASIIALAFSTAITSVSIDYMFHHYFHGFYDKKIKFNKSVFYGFITTMSVFILISFIDFPLINQISIFSIVSMSIAYIHFSFIYPYLGIKFKEPYSIKLTQPFSVINEFKIIVFSVIVIIISLSYVKFDFNIKNLDYQNVKQINNEYFFRNNLIKKNQSGILITGESINQLISNSKVIQTIDKKARITISSLLSEDEYFKKIKEIKEFNFESLTSKIKATAGDIGFKDSYFDNSYNQLFLYPKKPIYSKNFIESLGFKVIYHKDKYLTFAMVDNEKLDSILKLDFIKNAQSKTFFENSLKNVYNQLIFFGSISILLVIIILAVITRKKFFLAFNYILFPTTLIFSLGLFIPLNIMHIFMLFIILAISIDYGIYVHERDSGTYTKLAIIYSLISTFAGFGVLIISNINSLFSIACATIIGITGIVFLLIFQKKGTKDER